MAKDNATLNSLRESLLDEICRSAFAISNDALPSLSAFVARLSADPKRETTAGMIRRAAGRLSIVKHFGRLRSDPGNRGRSNRQLIIEAVRAAPVIAPGLRCSTRSLLKWVTNYNAIGNDGLAMGWTALIDKYGRPRKGDSNTA